MERDALISHGVSSFIQESMMKRSDAHEYLFDKESGRLDNTEQSTKLEIPYCAGLFIHEMESMHFQVKLS